MCSQYGCPDGNLDGLGLIGSSAMLGATFHCVIVVAAKSQQRFFLTTFPSVSCEDKWRPTMLVLEC